MTMGICEFLCQQRRYLSEASEALKQPRPLVSTAALSAACGLPGLGQERCQEAAVLEGRYGQ